MSSRRVIGAATAVAGLTMMMGAVLLAPESAEATHFTVNICHATNAATDTNPYNFIEVPYSAIDGLGHSDHSHHVGDLAVWYPGAKADGKSWGDIIPPVRWVIPSGLNWTAAGQAMWHDECVPPVPTTTTLPPTTTTLPPTTTTLPPTTTTLPPTTTTEAVTTTTEAVTTTTEAVTTTTEAVTTTSSESGGPTTTVAATTTSVASEGPTTTSAATTTSVASGGPTTTALSDASGALPTTGAGTSPILFLGMLTMLSGLSIMALGRRTA